MVAGVGFFSTSVGMLTISSAFSLLPSRLRYSEEKRDRKRNSIGNRERERERERRLRYVSSNINIYTFYYSDYILASTNQETKSGPLAPFGLR